MFVFMIRLIGALKMSSSIAFSPTNIVNAQTNLQLIGVLSKLLLLR